MLTQIKSAALFTTLIISPFVFAEGTEKIIFTISPNYSSGISANDVATEVPVKIYSHPSESCLKVYEEEALGITCSSKMEAPKGSVLRPTGSFTLSNLYKQRSGFFGGVVDETTETSYMHIEVEYVNPENGLEEKGYIAPQADPALHFKTPAMKLRYNLKHVFKTAKGLL